MHDLGGCGVGLSGNWSVAASCALAMVSSDRCEVSFARRLPDEIGRLEGLASAGTRNEATE
jgi:hypothetical protein